MWDKVLCFFVGHLWRRQVVKIEDPSWRKYGTHYPELVKCDRCGKVNEGEKEEEENE